MTKSWTYRSTQTGLKVFISSRIKECQKERAVIKKAVTDIYHHPILFEHVGARAYSPRDLYLSHLNDSNLMIGVYREGYGFIAESMQISGIEDELQFAMQKNIPSIFYVLDSDGPREQKLIDMLSTITNGPYTVFYYHDPADLEERVKSDITAEIVRGYLKSDTRREVIQESAEEVLSQANSEILINNQQELDELYDLHKTNFVVCLNGSWGTGKTTLSARIALKLDAVFIRATNLAPKDLFTVCVNAINKTTETNALPLNLEDARLSFLNLWKESEGITLVLDDCEFIPELIESINSAGGFNDNKKLIFTAKEPSGIYTNYSLELLNQKPTVLIPKVANVSNELLHYLTVNNRPLTVSDLLALRGDNQYSVSQLMEDLAPLKSILNDSPKGFTVNDKTAIQTITEKIKESPQLHKFYINRLIGFWEQERNYRQVYWLASQLGDGSEKEFQNLAAHEAAKLGDWKLGVSILSKMLADAKDYQSKSNAFELLISLIYPLELLGQTQKSIELLDEAKNLSLSLSEGDQYKIQEVEISAKARKGIEVKDVEALKGIFEHYKNNGSEWDQARIGLELSAIYLGAKEFKAAIDILGESVEIFTGLEDEYGVDLCERNLVSAFTAINENSSKVKELLARIETRSRDSNDQRRQRAWICNIQTRVLRREKKFPQAEALAKEAISIADDLGDEYLKSLNLINLGNVYRDQKLPELALESYELSGIAAVRCGRKDIEADSSRLSAGILNDFTEIPEIVNSAELAKKHALHAIDLIKNGINLESLAGSYQELGEAYSRLNEMALSAEAYFESAKLFKKSLEEEDYEYALIEAYTTALPTYPTTYLKGLMLTLSETSKDIDGPLIDLFLETTPLIIEKAIKPVLINLLRIHTFTAWSNIPPMYRGELVIKLIDKLATLLRVVRLDDWRTLYTGIVFMYLLKSRSEPYIANKLARTIAGNVDDIYFREEGDGLRTWTIVLNLDKRVSISISPLDESHETNIACFSLALFIKAFETELNNDILVGGSQITELAINVGRYNLLPTDLKKSIQKFSNIEQTLNGQVAAVTRPTQFAENTPTIVFLSDLFLDEFAFGENKGGALQILFGLTLIEVVYQMMLGEVDQEILRPKIVSLVRKTIF